MISIPAACPFCRGNRLVTGKLAGGIEESAAYIVLAGVSISFWKAEIRGTVNAVVVEKHVVLCLGCGMAWAKADERSALKLMRGHGSKELKSIALTGGSPDAQPRSDELLQCRPESDAAPNGGPAAPVDNSNAIERPLSVSSIVSRERHRAMETISKCRVCGSERLLHGTMHDSSFAIPNPVFRLIHSDTPSVAPASDVATACLDCGTILTRADPLDLQKTAGRWMSDDAKKRALRLESTLDSTLDSTKHFLGFHGSLVVVAVAIIVAILVVYAALPG